jgi:uncharacterized protein YceK
MNRMNTKRRLSFLVLLAVVSLAGCSNEKTRTAPSPETVRNIPVLAVQQRWGRYVPPKPVTPPAK